MTSKKTILNWNEKETEKGLFFWEGIAWSSFYTVLIGLLYSGVVVGSQFCFRLIFDYVIPINKQDVKITWTLAFALFFATKLALDWIIKRVNIMISIDYKRRWNIKFFYIINEFSYFERKRKTTPIIIKHLQYLNEILDFHFPILINFFQSISLIVISLIILFSYMNLIIMVIFLFFALSFLFVFAFSPLKKAIEKKKIKSDKNLSQTLINGFENIQDRKRRNIHNLDIDEWKKEYEKNLKINLKDEKFSRFYGLVSSIFLFCSKIAIIFLILKNGEEGSKIINAGSFIFLFGLSMNIIEKSLQIVNFFFYKQRIKKLKKDVLNFLTKEEAVGKNNFFWSDKNNKIEVRSLNFSYDSDKRIWEKNIDFQFEKSVIFLGKPGTGKSTFLKIIAKELKASEGQILFNDQNINDIEKNSWQENFCFITAKSKPYSGTIFESIINHNREKNIHEKWKDYKIESWLEKVSLKSKNNVSTKSLSSGQKQVIIFLSLFFQKAKIILVDEALSAISSRLRVELISFFMKKNKKKMFFYATHDSRVESLFETIQKF